MMALLNTHEKGLYILPIIYVSDTLSQVLPCLIHTSSHHLENVQTVTQIGKITLIEMRMDKFPLQTDVLFGRVG